MPSALRRAFLCFAVSSALALSLAQTNLASGNPGSAAAAPTPATSMTTPEHWKSAVWWPTRPLPPEEQSRFVGAATCGRCHRNLYESQRTSQMARTLHGAADSTVLRDHLQAQYHAGPYTYRLQQKSAAMEMLVTDGGAAAGQSRSAVLQWAFGSGDVGQSYLWQQDGSAEGKFYEARFNYFASLQGFDATPGRLHGPPASLEMAVGRPLEEFEVKSCFSCHSTTMSSTSPFDVKTVVPGVTCEACHGPGAEHVSAMQSAQSATAAGTEKHIVNAARMTPAQAVDFCGACHSTPWDVRLMGAAGMQTVRFPAYRLEKSRCWRTEGDARLTCTGCHDPHQPLARDPAAYDRACLRCHAVSGHAAAVRAAGAAVVPGGAVGMQRACPVATTKCVNCHMPKYELPELHARFTDHDIRIARSGESFPD